MESLRLELADREALFEEHDRAVSAAHAELEDKHKDVLFGLRQTEDKVSFATLSACDASCHSFAP